MDLIISPVNAVSINASLPVIVTILNALSRPCEITLVFQMENYSFTRMFFHTKESGGKFQISIQGKPGFCLAVLQNLIGEAKTSDSTKIPIDMITERVAEMQRWQLRTPISDFFQSPQEFRVTANDSNTYQFEKIPIVYTSESGAKFLAVVKGKPGFGQTAAMLLQQNAPILRRMIARTFE